MALHFLSSTAHTAMAEARAANRHPTLVSQEMKSIKTKQGDWGVALPLDHFFFFLLEISRLLFGPFCGVSVSQK